MAKLSLRPADELAQLVRSGEVTAEELLEDCLQQVDRVEPQINAFTLIDPDRAAAEARAIKPGDPRPFCGVPIAIKDNVAVAGWRLTFASDLFGDYKPNHDAFLVRRLREAGFVVMGKTNMPEFGILPVTGPRRFGPTRNPWDLARPPGGSSGGAAAAVAAGMVPVAHGNDGGGSIRIPAACCGLVGLKPSRGRISRGPEEGDDFLVQDGVLTRTVRETAMLLDVLAGYEPGDASWAPPPRGTFAAAAERDPERLRIGVVTKPPLPTEVDPMALDAVRRAADLLTELGHEVLEVDPPWGEVDLLPTFTRIFGTQIAALIELGQRIGGREIGPEVIEQLSLAVYESSRQGSGIDFFLSLLELQGAARAIVSLLFFGENRHDALLTPALAKRPVAIEEIAPTSDDPWGEFRKSGEFTPFTAVCNISGQPAIVLPLYQGDDGLPLAVQLIGPPAGEELLLSLAGQVERAAPWHDRFPALALAGD